ncbi:MAG: hypothetical protein IBJ03_03275 [Gemmatimonadaceae bacterium]|nr:hypothetical protein [Gemmatimonadaceae bacterium]
MYKSVARRCALQSTTSLSVAEVREMTSNMEGGTEGAKDPGADGTPPGRGVYHVNERNGRVDAHGEELLGREILSRVGLSTDKYELWTEVAGKTGESIEPNERHFTKPGDHFRATIRGTDYSNGMLQVVVRT